MDHVDEQTFMVRFESMRRPILSTNASSGASGRRQLLITHAELRRQCTVAVRGFEFDTRMSVNELRRQTLETEARLARIKADQSRLRREQSRCAALVTDTEARHARMAVQRYNQREEIERRQRPDELPLDTDVMLGIVEGLALPASVKKHLEEPILAGAFRIKC